METKILIDVFCIHCESKIHLQKKRGQEQCKLICPGCKKELHLLFNLKQDPQTYSFLSTGQSSYKKEENTPNREKSSDKEWDKANKDKTIYKKKIGKAKIYEDEIPGEEESGKVNIKKQNQFKLTESLYLVRKKLLGFVTERYQLFEGKTIIGRVDDEEPSDISIRGDDTISRRSICIEIKADEYGFDYILKVLNASNPVKLNGKNIKMGEKVYLDIGDVITIGHTNLKFDNQ